MPLLNRLQNYLYFLELANPFLCFFLRVIFPCMLSPLSCVQETLDRILWVAFSASFGDYQKCFIAEFVRECDIA